MGLFLIPIEATAVEARKFDIDGNFMFFIEHCVAVEGAIFKIVVTLFIDMDSDLYKFSWLGRLYCNEADLADRRAYEGDLSNLKSS